jgi:hypothetical protein
MMELILAVLLVFLVWGDSATTYLFLKKAKDYGYPRWSEEETSPLYRYFVRRYGLVRGIVLAAVINPLVFVLLSHLIFINLSMIVSKDVAVGLGYGIFYGMIFNIVHRNYYVYYLCPASKYNEKIMGRPKRPEKHKLC